MVKLEENSASITVAPARIRPALAPVNGPDMGFVDLLRILKAHVLMIGLVSLAGGAAAAGVAFLLPDMFTATAVLMPPQQPQTAVSALVGQLGPLASMAGTNMALKSPSDLFVGLVGGRTIADHVIEQFGLKALYSARTMVDARGQLRGHSRFTAGKDSLIKIEVDDHDPRRAADIANAYVAELNSENSGFGTNEAYQRRIFLERQVMDERAQLSAAEEAMKQAQTKTGIIHVEAQASVAIASAAQLKAQITAEEVALKRLEMGAAPENPEVLRTKTEIEALRGQLIRLQVEPHVAGDPLMATGAMPTAGLEYMRTLRELKYHEFLFEILSKQYEAARIDESKVAPALLIVDAAVPPDKKSGPHRGLIILFGLIAAATAASIAAYLRATSGRPQSPGNPYPPAPFAPTGGENGNGNGTIPAGVPA